MGVDCSAAGFIDALCEVARTAGARTMDYFGHDAGVSFKDDQSPLTLADTASDEVICAALARLHPDTPVISEEAAAKAAIDVDGEFFLVDPLDGTKEFIQNRTDFTVNIALIRGGVPVAGVVYAPALDALYAGTEGAGSRMCEGPGGSWRPIRIRACPADGLITAVASKSHNTPETDDYLARFAVGERVSVGSSLKFCLVAAGRADLYPRIAPTYEWDTAAGDAVLRSAGGSVLGLDGRPLLYGKPRFWNPGFVACGDLKAPAAQSA